MKKYFYILAALTISPQFSLAQDASLDLDAELDQVVVQQKQAVAGAEVAKVAAPVQTVAAMPVTTVNTSAGTIVPMNTQPVYIVQQSPAMMAPVAEVQKQPTTLIEDTPLTTSKAEQIRKARQDAEVETEQKIVEKLEVSRMEDEKRRADALFGEKFDNLQNKQQAAPVQAPVEAAPVAPVAQPQPIIIQQAPQPVVEENTRDVVREEIRAALESEKELPVAPVETRYFSAFIGAAEYPDVANVRGNVSLGATFGTKFDDVMAIEGTFTYSNFTVDPNAYYAVDVKQYSGSVAGKYLFFTGMFRPILGGALQYSYRQFAYDNNGYTTYSNNNSDASSHAFDVGVVTGADLEFNSRFALGFDFRYMFNLASRVSSNTTNTWGYSNAGTPIEKLQYYTMSVVGRVNF